MTWAKLISSRNGRTRELTGCSAVFRAAKRARLTIPRTTHLTNFVTWHRACLTIIRLTMSKWLVTVSSNIWKNRGLRMQHTVETRQLVRTTYFKRLRVQALVSVLERHRAPITHYQVVEWIGIVDWGTAATLISCRKTCHKTRLRRRVHNRQWKDISRAARLVLRSSTSEMPCQLTRPPRLQATW